MTHNDGFDRTVSAWLDEQAGQGMPGYLGDVLARTTRTRQRPWWSSLERWLPMQSTARFAQVPRMAWLLVVLGLVLALGTVLLIAGSPRRPPSPFGPGAHGTVLYAAADGDIYAIDSATNVAHPLVTGAAADSNPLFAPDGSRFAFVRREVGADSTSIVVAKADGSDPRQLTGFPQDVTGMVWSPDGTRLAVADADGMWVIGPDVVSTKVASSVSDANKYGWLESPQWRPNGHELIYVVNSLELGVKSGIYLVQSDGSGMRPIVGSTRANPLQPSLSADGTKVAYSIEGDGGREIHVADVETGVDRRVAFDGTAADVRPHFSPDGTKLVFERSGAHGFQLMIGSVTGGPVTAMGPTQPDKSGGAEVRFSPDGTKILAFYNGDRSSWVLDPSGGPGTRLAYDAVTPPTWQHPAP